MNGTDMNCSRCGAPMTQTGSEHNRVRYHCMACGNNTFVEMSAADNTAYWQERSELLERVRMGVLEWKTTQWDYLSKDIVRFVGRYDCADGDVCFKIAIIACLTKGFHDMSNEKYKECKALFKVTERAYKLYCKSGSSNGFEGSSDVATYEEYRALYKKCRNDYRNTKMLWKIAFFFAKKLVPTLPF